MRRRASRSKMRSGTWCSLVPAELHPLARAAIVLLALIQIVAPSWHVCALGGSSASTCCHVLQAEHEKPARPAAPKPKHDGPRCLCKPAQGEASTASSTASSAPTSFLSSAPGDCGFHGTCLARLLMGMPGSLAAGFHLASLSKRRAIFVPLPVAAPLVAALPQPPSRGPPLF